MNQRKKSKCVPTKPKLEQRSLLDDEQARQLESTFKILANATRLRLLHALVQSGELCVSEVAEKLEMSPQAVSNQLQRLSDRSIVEARREGLQMHYYIIDPCVVVLLDRGWCLTEDSSERTIPKARRAS